MDKEPFVTNEIRLSGKVSRQTQLRYTPAGFPVKEFTLAFHQAFLESTNMGYIDVVLSGDPAEAFSKMIRVGAELSVVGKIWTRQYKSRQGVMMREVKVVAEKISTQTEKCRS